MANRPGERNSNARISNADVELLRDLFEADPGYWTTTRLAEKFEISRRQVNYITSWTKRITREDEDD